MKKKNGLRVEQWAEFNKVEIIRDKCVALFLGSKTQMWKCKMGKNKNNL